MTILGRPGVALLKQAPKSLLPYSDVDVLHVSPAAQKRDGAVLAWRNDFFPARPDALVEQMTHDNLPSRAETPALVHITYIL